MDRMREEINLVKKQTGDPAYSKFHTQVAQITFNAWHYVDANLWASLVSHILEKLVEEITPKPNEMEVRKKLVRELQTAKELRAEAEEEKQRAANERKEAEIALSKVAAQRAQKQVELSSLRATDLWRFVKDDSELKESIDTALKSLEVPTLLSSIQELDAVTLEARSLGTQWFEITLAPPAASQRRTQILHHSWDEPSKGRGLGRGELSRGANQLDGVGTACGINLPHDAPQMILHRELRYIESGRDFLICHALGYKTNELQLPWSEDFPIATLPIRHHGFLVTLFAQMANQVHAKARGAGGFAADSGIHSRDNLGGRGFFEQIAADAQRDRLQKDVRVLVHTEKKHFNS